MRHQPLPVPQAYFEKDFDMELLPTSGPSVPSDVESAKPALAANGSESTAKGEAKTKPKTKPKTSNQTKTFEEKLEYWSKKINDQMDSTFLAYLQVGKALRSAAAGFSAECKTMADFDQWVTEKCDFNPKTASKFRRMSEFFHVENPAILDDVNKTYLRKLEFTIVHDLFSAWEALRTGKKSNLDHVKWNSDGIFAKFGDEEDYIDVMTMTTRELKKKLKLSAPKEAGEEHSADTKDSANGDEAATPDSDTAVGPHGGDIPDAHEELGQMSESELRIQIVELRTRHKMAVNEHKKREEELLQELESAKRREEELKAELEQLRAQVSGGKVGE